MPGRDFYTLSEAAQILELSQRRLLEWLETGEIEGERDPQSGRWKISKQAADERVSADTSAEEDTEEPPGSRQADRKGRAGAAAVRARASARGTPSRARTRR